MLAATLGEGGGTMPVGNRTGSCALAMLRCSAISSSSRTCSDSASARRRPMPSDGSVALSPLMERARCSAFLLRVSGTWKAWLRAIVAPIVSVSRVSSRSRSSYCRRCSRTTRSSHACSSCCAVHNASRSPSIATSCGASLAMASALEVARISADRRARMRSSFSRACFSARSTVSAHRSALASSALRSSLRSRSPLTSRRSASLVRLASGTSCVPPAC
mmetsp:Transcript_12253/g.37565  ORF Transcript_12253/g.37565 Transcript_12253/m.37565 type:complete len:219 (+) Transcript_12253:223-879(+)